MGRARQYTQSHQARLSSSARQGHRRAEHPLLELQRTAGNQAVVELVQRRERPYSSSVVAVAPMEHIYDGKCDAKLEGASVRKSSSRGLMGKDTALIFECGPQSFRFVTFRGWFSDRFPWTLDVADGSAFVEDSISRSLDDISDDMDDAGAKFWGGYHTIKTALATDLHNFCGS